MRKNTFILTLLTAIFIFVAITGQSLSAENNTSLYTKELATE